MAHAAGGGAGGSFAWLSELPGFSVIAGARFFVFIITATSIMNLRRRIITARQRGRQLPCGGGRGSGHGARRMDG